MDTKQASTSEVAKHTPGPWAVRIEDDPDATSMEPDRVGWVYRDIPNSCGQGIAKLATWGYAYESDEEAQANARLIAAAPELLEACKCIAACDDDERGKYWGTTDWHEWVGDAIANARAAIASATGQGGE